MRRIEAWRKNASALRFPILGQPSTAVEPSESALDDPACGQDHESLGVIGMLDDFSFEVG
jgi:hypothetical protein